MSFLKNSIIIGFLICICFAVDQNRNLTQNDDKIIKFAFGSCNRPTPDKPSFIFKDILEQKPDFFMWTGDAAYVDVRIAPMLFQPDYNKSNVERKFREVYDDPYYSKLRQKVPIIGIWDDHDYGQNDGDTRMPTKVWMRDSYLDFLGESKQSKRRSREGIYESYYLGKKNFAKLVLLDIRYSRDGDDMLGEQQWRWLKEELSDQKVEVFFLTSGTQLIPDDRLQEHWSYKSRQRLYRLIGDLKKRVIIISGDVHFAEFLQDECAQNLIGYPLYEITSSGLNLLPLHWQPLSFFTSNIGDAMRVGLTYTYSNDSDRFLPDDTNEGLNYGIIQIKEDSEDVLDTQIVIQIYTLQQKKPVINKLITLRQINPEINRQIPNCEFNRLSPQYRWFAYFFTGVFVKWSLLSWKIFLFLTFVFIGIPAIAIFILAKIASIIFCRKKKNNENKNKKEN